VLRRKFKLSDVIFRRYFKLNVFQADYVFKRLTSMFPCSPEHFLWTLHFIKTRDPDFTMVAGALNTCERTLLTYVSEIASNLRIALPEFDFENRFDGWNFLSPSFLVDTTFVRIKRPHLHPWEYFRKEKGDFGMLYQIACSLSKPFRFLHFDGPFKCSAAEVSIFRATLVPRMRKGERVMTDKGYYQDTERCWHPPLGPLASLSSEDKLRRRQVTRIRHLNERIIGRLTTWGCFKRRWNGHWRLQEDCCFCAAKLTQLELYCSPLT